MGNYVTSEALTHRQLSFIPYLLSCTTIEEACRQANISKPTAYKWKKEDVFKDELRRRSDEIHEATLQRLIAGMDAGVAKLRELLNSENENVALRAANDLIAHGFKAAELANLRTERDAEQGQEDTSEIFSVRTIVQAWQEDEEREKREREEKRRAAQQQAGIESIRN